MEKFRHIKLSLIAYDLIVAAFSVAFVFFSYLHFQGRILSGPEALVHGIIFIIFVTVSRLFWGVYTQIWRYGGVQCYLRLMAADAIAFLFLYAIERLFFGHAITFAQYMTISCLNLILALAIRLIYRYCYKCGNEETSLGRFLNALLTVFTFGTIKSHNISQTNKIAVAILGAGNLGASLSDELMTSSSNNYIPRFFVDADISKKGKVVNSLPVFFEEDVDKNLLISHEIQEVIFAIPNLSLEKRKELYSKYSNMGVKVKNYDCSNIRPEGGKASVREFDVEELLFRKQIVVVDDFTKKYFQGKTVLITGGGGSIGSEMARQIAKMHPKKLVLLDIAENGVYNLNVDLKFAYGNRLDFSIEIADVTDKKTLKKIFQNYRPQIVIHCAAHKHVPLMEHNCVEAIRNNCLGTLNTVLVSEECNVERFIMVSTDKAVNPVNVMGATKRVCEMIVNAHANSKTKTTFSTTRFGNVLGSAGSVIPIFKRQMSEGGPLTITDFRIIRYFMTIPEASQLVLKSAAMAKNGELFVLDMGKPVKILDLAENMIRLSGMEPYRDIDIIETGLRPGEKLYEELLIQPDKMDKTDDELIFIEHDTAISMEELESKLNALKNAVDEGDDEKAKAVLKAVVPTFRNPEDVNEEAIEKNLDNISLADN